MLDCGLGDLGVAGFFCLDTVSGGWYLVTHTPIGARETWRFGFQISDFGYRVPGLGVRVSGIGFWIQVSGFGMGFSG